MKVFKILSRIYVELDQFDGILSFYERICGEKCRLRFSYSKLGLELGQVGSVLLIAGAKGDLEMVRATQMTFLVDSVFEFRDRLVAEGGTILEGPQVIPTGLNLRAKHPDGIIVEYVEHRT